MDRGWRKGGGHDKRSLGMGMRVGSCLTVEQSGMILVLWDLRTFVSEGVGFGFVGFGCVAGVG